MKVRFDATGDVIVVTGSANGIGRALALGAAAVGARVVACDVDATGLQELAVKEPRITVSQLDVSDRDAVFEVFGGIEKEFGHIDGLVCAAAVQPRTPAHAMPPEEWQRVLQTNLDGVVWCYQAAVPGMMARQHRRLQLGARASRLASGVRLCGDQGRAHRLRQKRRQGGRAASRAIQPHRPRRDRHSAISRRQRRRG
jgi:2-hydroxycyclohexanecarboxyl-CoA dehydrogenase